MTATTGAPDPLAAAEERWQRIEEQLAAVGHRMRTDGDAAIASLDVCLARLEAMREALRTSFAQVEQDIAGHQNRRMPRDRHADDSVRGSPRQAEGILLALQYRGLAAESNRSPARSV
ncbi:hypothetical protein [Kitasatospora sp. NPDC001683]